MKPAQNKNAIKKGASINPKKENSFSAYLIIVFCFPILLYLQTLTYGFTYFDDNGIILDNINYLKHFSNAFNAFLINTSAFYRPLQTVSYMIDIQLSGAKSTWMFHLSNVLLLGLIASMLFLLLRRLSVPPRLAFTGALIYSVHPLFVSAIAWIPARGDLQLTLFSLLSFIFFIDFLQKGKLKYMFLNWAAFTIALFCKETAVFLPFLFIIYLFTIHKGKRFEKKYIYNALLYGVSGIVWFWMRTKAIGDFTDHDAEFGFTAFIASLRVIPESLSKFFLPIFNEPNPGFSVFKTLAGIAIILLIVIVFFKNKQRSKKELLFCFSWFLILMLPPMLYKSTLIDYLDHRFFIPLIGILIFVLFIFPKKWLVKGDIKISWLLVVVFVYLCSFTFIKSQSYSDPMTFYNSAISHNSNSGMAYCNRGILKINKSDFQGALDDFNKAIALNPNYSEAYNNRGTAKSYLGDKQGALEDYNKAIIHNPNYADAYNNRGIAKANMNDNIGAEKDFTKAIAVFPNHPDAYYNRAIARYSLKDFTGAIADCDIILKISPNDQKASGIKAGALQELQKKNY